MSIQLFNQGPYSNCYQSVDYILHIVYILLVNPLPENDSYIHSKTKYINLV